MIEKSRGMITFLLVLILVAYGYALTPQEEKQIIKDLTEIKTSLRVFMGQVDKRFDQMQKSIDERFEQIDKRFEQIDKRFEQVDRRFEQINNELNRLVNIMVGIFVAQIGLVGGIVGFALWDRKTIVSKAKRETIEELERDVKPERLRRLLNALRELAKEDEKLADVLKREGLL